jgi:hypothetical protein
MLAAEDALELVLPLILGGTEQTVVTVLVDLILPLWLEFKLEIPDVALEIEPVPPRFLVYLGTRGLSSINILYWQKFCKKEEHRNMTVNAKNKYVGNDL